MEAQDLEAGCDDPIPVPRVSEDEKKNSPSCQEPGQGNRDAVIHRQPERPPKETSRKVSADRLTTARDPPFWAGVGISAITIRSTQIRSFWRTRMCCHPRIADAPASCWLVSLPGLVIIAPRICCSSAPSRTACWTKALACVRRSCWRWELDRIGAVA